MFRPLVEEGELSDEELHNLIRRKRKERRK